MPDAPGATATPGGDGGGAPAPAPAPSNPAPAGPGAATPPAPAPAAKPPTPQEAADAVEDKEWDDAADEIFPGLKSTNKDKNNEQTKSKKGDEKTDASANNPDGKTPNAGEGDGNDTPPEGGDNKPPDAGEANKPDTAARDTRLAQQEWSKRVETIKTDVRSKLYPDLKETLVDADGDPIKTIDDVMKLVNPNTKELFTDVEAGQWLLAAQQKFNDGMAQLDKQVTAIAELNADFKDQVDIVNYKYGAWLKANPELRDELFAEWSGTLKTDANSGIITDMPYALEKFYDRAIGHRVEAEQKATADQEAAAKAQSDAAAKEAAEAQADAETKRQQKRADRSDVYAPPADPSKQEDPEDKEWGDAAKAYYGNAIK